jgi:hypothetical protein
MRTQYQPRLTGEGDDVESIGQEWLPLNSITQAGKISG